MIRLSCTVMLLNIWSKNGFMVRIFVLTESMEKYVMENYNWQELHNLIRGMFNKLNEQNSVERKIPRINYSELLNILINFSVLQYDKSISFRITGSKDNISLKLWRRE